MCFVTNVFINCPFDKNRIDKYLKPMFFCLVTNGLTPKIALESQDSGQLRIDKIVDLMKSSKYSIHDLSLLKLKRGAMEYARMNMPYKLGIDYGLRNSGQELYEQKKFLVLGNKRYEYMKALSDISGFDIQNYNNSTEKLFECMHPWLSSLQLQRIVPPALIMHYDYISFNAWLYSKLLTTYGEEATKECLKDLTWSNYKLYIDEYIQLKEIDNQ